MALINEKQIDARPVVLESPDGERVSGQARFDGGLQTHDREVRTLLHEILTELKILNTHMGLVTDHELSKGDVDA